MNRPLLTFLNFAILFQLSGGIIQAQTPIENEIFIWSGIAPGSDTVTVSEEIEDRDPDGGLCYLNRVVTKVTQPSIKHFAPDNPNGSAVLICPGGGYALLAYDKEGYDIAQWYNERDITAFVLKYRLPIDGHENRKYVPLQDAQRALRYIRANAETYNIHPDSIGVMGGSAGGHLAASLSVFYDWEVYTPEDTVDDYSAKPNFSVLMYPVISFQDDLTHGGSRNNLLGTPISQSLKDSFSTELHVDNQTPPAFLFHSILDGSVQYENSVAYADALQNAGVSHSLNLYDNGGHGVGKCEAGSTQFSQWPVDLDAWLVEQSWTTPCLGDVPVITMTITDSTRLASSPAMSYQWYRNGVLIEGATDSSYVPWIVGDYKVAISGEREGSGSACLVFSEEVTVDVISDIVNPFETPASIYPNPVTSELIIELSETVNADFNYHIYNQLGECVLQERNVPFARYHSIDVTKLSSGMYYIVCSIRENTTTTKFVKSQK